MINIWQKYFLKNIFSDFFLLKIFLVKIFSKENIFGENILGEIFFWENFFWKNIFGKNIFDDNIFGENIFGKNIFGNNIFLERLSLHANHPQHMYNSHPLLYLLFEVEGGGQTKKDLRTGRSTQWLFLLLY